MFLGNWRIGIGYFMNVMEGYIILLGDCSVIIGN